MYPLPKTAHFSEDGWGLQSRTGQFSGSVIPESPDTALLEEEQASTGLPQAKKQVACVTIECVAVFMKRLQTMIGHPLKEVYC
jgi:hypothetical protein